MNPEHSPRVSVIVPTYNCARFIPEALDSIFAQSFPAFEVVVVDDGSTDDTESVVRRMRRPQLTYVRKPNGGVSSARNTGLELTRSELVAFLDADDIWHPEMLARQVDLLQSRTDLVFCFTNFRRFRENPRRILGEQFQYYIGLNDIPSEPSTVADCRVVSGDAFSWLVRLWDVPAFTQVMLFRRSLIQGLHFSTSLPRCEDLHFVLRAALRGRVAFNPAVLADVRRHDTNLSADVSGMVVDKLAALEALEGLVDRTDRLRAYRERLLRARFDVARYHWRTRSYRRALSQLGLAMSRPGQPMQKLHGASRFLLHSLVRR